MHKYLSVRLYVPNMISLTCARSQYQICVCVCDDVSTFRLHTSRVRI